MKQKQKLNIENRRILAQGVTADNDTRKTHINNNDALVGPSGGGKTRSYVEPNIIHARDSLIVTDTKGNLFRKYKDFLERKGYSVMNLNFTNPLCSLWGYNPLRYVRKDTNRTDNKNGDYYMEQDVKKIAAALCPVQSQRDSSWDYFARMYLECFMLHILNYTPKKNHSLYNVYDYLCRMDDDNFKTAMMDTCDEYPNSAFARKYLMILSAKDAEKMVASIRGILSQHLDTVCHTGTRHMFEMSRQIKLEDFLTKKIALFLSVSDSDRTQDNIVNCFYTQALQFLMDAADKRMDSRLPIPVRFILDDFSTNTVIPDFDNIISVIRSREIYVSLVMQSITQLDSLYGADRARTILNNCDNCLYFGGSDYATIEYFAHKLNRMPYTVQNMPLDTVYLFTRGQLPRQVQQYNLNNDPCYKDVCRQMEMAM